MFKLSPSVEADYRNLRYLPDARREMSIIPLSTWVWEDEHPGGKCMLPDMDDESRRSIMRLVAARTALWLDGQVPRNLEQIWNDARIALPEWPGFRRLSLEATDREAVRRIRRALDVFEEKCLAEADEVHRVVDDTGIVQVTARFNLNREKGERHGGHDDDN